MAWDLKVCILHNLVQWKLYALKDKQSEVNVDWRVTHSFVQPYFVVNIPPTSRERQTDEVITSHSWQISPASDILILTCSWWRHLPVTISLNDPHFPDPLLSYLFYPVSFSVFISNAIVTAYEILITKNDVGLKLHAFLRPWIEEFLTYSPVKSILSSPDFICLLSLAEMLTFMFQTVM
jgi:hypothetical protein